MGNGARISFDARVEFDLNIDLILCHVMRLLKSFYGVHLIFQTRQYFSFSIENIVEILLNITEMFLKYCLFE